MHRFIKTNFCLPCVERKIAAALYGNLTEATSVVLAVHGLNSAKGSLSNMLVAAEIIKKEFAAVLAIDLPRHGERKNHDERFSIGAASRDIIAALSFIKSKAMQNATLSVFATSMGAFATIAALSDDVCPKVDKIIFKTPAFSLQNALQNIFAEEDFSPQMQNRFFENLGADDDFFKELKRIETALQNGAFANIKLPICAVILGENDTITPKQKTLELLKLLSINTDIVIMPNEGHNFSLPALEQTAKIVAKYL
jgi:pimeloyl-ACP methyl ester carboxylesterase